MGELKDNARMKCEREESWRSCCESKRGKVEELKNGFYCDAVRKRRVKEGAV